MLTLPNFERLKVFHSVYGARGIQRAAELLHVTRSAISQSLKSLEDELGTVLFVRDARRFQPTPEADELFRAVDPFIHNLRATLEKRAEPGGHLRIGAPMDFGSDRLTGLMARFRRRHPSVTFELQLDVPVRQLEKLGEGKLDIAFIDNGDVHAGKFPVKVQPFLRETFVMAASPERARGLRGFEALSQAPIVDYLRHAPVARLWFKHHFSRAPVELEVAYSAESVRGVLTAIKGDIGIGVVPERLLEGEFKSLKRIETTRTPWINQIMIARGLGRTASKRESDFVAFCKSELKS